MKKSLHHIASKHVHKRILLQLVIFVIASIILLGISGYDVLQWNISIAWVGAGIIIGLLIGFLAGRMFSIKWHEDTQKVILGMDRLSIILIVVYIGFRMFEKQLFGEFLTGQALTDVTFASLSGIMIGRMLSMLRSIQKILKEQKIIH